MALKVNTIVASMVPATVGWLHRMINSSFLSFPTACRLAPSTANVAAAS